MTTTKQLRCGRGHPTREAWPGERLLPCGCVYATAIVQALEDAGWPPPSPLAGEWTPRRVLYLARAEEIDALCEVMNALPHFRPDGGMIKADDPGGEWVRFSEEDWAALEVLRKHAGRAT